MMKIVSLLFLLLLTSCSISKVSNRKIYAGWSIHSFSAENSIHWKKVNDFDSIEDAKSFILKKVDGVREHIKPKLDPYTGELLGLNECLPENQPVGTIKEDNDNYLSTLYFLSSGANTLGQCFESNKLLKTNYNILYCKKTKGLFIIKYFYDNKSDWIKDLRILCN